MRQGNVESVKLLVQAGVEVNIKDDKRSTALDTAVSHKLKECGEYLYSVGAKFSRQKYPITWK